MNSLSPQTREHRGCLLTKLPNGKWYRYWTRPNGCKVRQYFVEIKCSQCGAPSFSSITRARLTKHSFCSHDCKNKFLRGANHPGWREGFQNNNGHRFVRCQGHPRARNNSGYVAEHILVVEKALGRYLVKGERVHHIDCDKDNNTPENLAVMSLSQHSSAHQSVNGILKGLIAS